MRKLQFQDIFKASRLLVDLDLKEEIKEIGLKADKIEDIEVRGFELFWTVFEKATTNNSEKNLYEFLAGLMECTPEEMRVMELDKILDELQSINVEEWKAFFKRVASLMK